MKKLRRYGHASMAAVGKGAKDALDAVRKHPIAAAAVVGATAGAVAGAAGAIPGAVIGATGGVAVERLVRG